MAFDGIVCSAIVSQLRDSILLGKIEKVHQPEKDELIFVIHTKTGKKKLYMSAASSHMGLYLTDMDYQNPSAPPSFCMLLRKHLQSGRIINITQKDFERIIEIDFETRDELGFEANKKLIIEIMGKHSNIILVDSKENKILDCIKKISFDLSRARQILPGLQYEYPPSQDKIAFTSITPHNISHCNSSKDLLGTIQGISPLIAEELFASSDIGFKITSLQDRIKAMDYKPTVYFKDNNDPLDFHVLPLDFYSDVKQKTFDSISQCIQYFYMHKDSANRVKQKSSDLVRVINGLIKKHYLKKQRLLEDIEKAKNADRYKLLGELITANIYLIEKGMEKVDVINYYDNKETTIPLDSKLTPSQNSQKYYKRYNKAKTAIIEKQIQLDDNEKEIQYLESVLSHIDLSQKTEEIDLIKDELIESGYIRLRKKNNQKKKKNKSEPYLYNTSDNLRILVGRNNKENDILTFKTANRTDIWFHTKDIPGSHTILFTQGNIPSDTAIFEAAAIAAYHSKAQKSENVPVDYTQVRFVKKPSGAKPGMVIFTDNKTVYVTPKLPE
ncbi:MAG: NFACT RNA binding domain-containing protein [Anaerovoracaceae bacterium]